MPMLTQSKLKQISNILSAGGVIGLPTDTVYGLACDAFNTEAVQKITNIKGREAAKYYVLQIANIEQLNSIVKPLTDKQLTIIKTYWPGEITFIFQKSSSFLLPYLTDTVGIRIPNHQITKDILAYYNKPLVVTSLNRSGEPAVTDYKEISEDLKNDIDYLVVSEEKGSNIASTIVDLSQELPLIIRQGKVIFS